MERLIARGGVHSEVDDFLRGGGSDLFDVHAALGGADKADAGCGAINEQGEVQLCLNAGAVFDVDAVHLLARRAGLVRDQGAAKHLLGFLGRFAR